MVHHSFGNNQEFCSFVVSALVSEASKEEKRVLLDYKLNNGYIVDIYFPNGLSIFGRDYQPPFIIEVNKTYKQDTVNKLVELLNSLNFKGTLFHISQDNWVVEDWSANPLVTDNFDIVPLGYNFVNQLRERNPDAYLNHILGNPKTTLKKESGSSNENGYGNREHNLVLLLVEGTNEEYPINKEDPDKINAINEKEFIAHLNDDPEKSNCAVIIGNGVSIPFGSDNWSSMIKNLVDRLEPFHIEKREHVEGALSGSSYALSSFVKATLTREEGYDKYIEAIRYCIYRKYNGIMHDQLSLIDVIAKAKAKYKSLPLLTYNYDTFIERQYYHNTRHSLNYYCGDRVSDDIETISKSNVIHLHGYISYLHNKYKGIILTDEDYYDAYLNAKSWTYKTQVQVLRDYTCLFVGSSMSDLFQMSLIQKAKKGDRDKKWSCYALMCFENLEFKEKVQIIKYYKEKGIQVIFVEDYSELPNKLKRLFKI